MAFGRCNAPATFQCLVNIVLTGVSNCNVYLDDLVIHTSTRDDHVSVLKWVFTRLSDTSLTINLAKCDLGEATVTYLGRRVGQGQVPATNAKVVSLQTETPYVDFLAWQATTGASAVIHPPTCILSPKVDFLWTLGCQHALEIVKSFKLFPNTWCS